MQRASITAALLACVVLAGCANGPARPQTNAAYIPQFTIDQDTVQVPLINDRNYEWRVRADVDGTVGTFILDTGAPVTMVSPQFALKAQLPDYADEAATSGRRVKRGQFADVVLLRLGAASYAFFYAPIVNLDHLSAALDTEIDGILGNNVLDQTAYTLDWKTNLLTLHAHPPPAPADAISIAVQQGRIYLPVNVDGQPVEYSLDTGAYRTLLSKHDLGALRIPDSKRASVVAPRIDIHSSHFDLEQTQATLDRFQAGPVLLTDFPVLIWDYNSLGMDVLSSYVLSVDARHGWMSLAPQPPAP